MFLMIDPHKCPGTCLQADAECSLCLRMTAHTSWFVLRHALLKNGAIICPSCAKTPPADAVARIQANWDRANA